MMKRQWHHSILVAVLLFFLANGCKDDPIEPEPGTFTDLDGNAYYPVRICDQEWLNKNLNVSKFRNGDPIPKVTDDAAWRDLTTPAYCYYNNDSSAYAATYGKLYNWYAVNDPRGLAPEGWHIPTHLEWTILSTCLGGDDLAFGSMKEAGEDHWLRPNIGATNSSKFTALPGGDRYEHGWFEYIRNFGSWWSSSETDTGRAWYRSLHYFYSNLSKNDSTDKRRGLSVRCLKDE